MYLHDILIYEVIFGIWNVNFRAHLGAHGAEVQKVVNPVILDDRKYIQNQGLAENISKT